MMAICRSDHHPHRQRRHPRCHPHRRFRACKFRADFIVAFKANSGRERLPWTRAEWLPPSPTCGPSHRFGVPDLGMARSARRQSESASPWQVLRPSSSAASGVRDRIRHRPPARPHEPTTISSRAVRTMGSGRSRLKRRIANTMRTREGLNFWRLWGTKASLHLRSSGRREPNCLRELIHWAVAGGTGLLQPSHHDDGQLSGSSGPSRWKTEKTVSLKRKPYVVRRKINLAAGS